MCVCGTGGRSAGRVWGGGGRTENRLGYKELHLVLVVLASVDISIRHEHRYVQTMARGPFVAVKQSDLEPPNFKKIWL